MSTRDLVIGGTDRSTDHVLTLVCTDQPGVVHAVSGFLLDHGCNLIESQQFVDRAAGTFFMRIQFESAAESPFDTAALRSDFNATAARFSMSWRLLDANVRQRVLILVSKYGHCLNDLLFRANDGGLGIDVVGVVSNHPDLGVLADNYDVPFYHLPVSAATKPEAEQQLVDLIEDLSVDLTVLARYMQILSAELCKQLEGRAINIHHSMLPSFKGARPYHQAYERGVKLIGATAHYVTSDLDEGPIIEQEVRRVDHSMSAADVTTLGRDTECLALSRAVRWHTENRVLLDGRRTVVFQ
ncbi:formyltetrahydrofolate deformylase [Mycobacterium sp. BMJ-28]